jgi:hypothetical protein
MAASDDQRQPEARNLQAGSPRFESGTAMQKEPANPHFLAILRALSEAL